MAALPDRPGSWIGVVLGKAAATAALSWTGKHPAAYDLVAMRLARVEADDHGLTMWETAALLTSPRPSAADTTTLAFAEAGRSRRPEPASYRRMTAGSERSPADAGRPQSG
jgi:hypothetical protein